MVLIYAKTGDYAEQDWRALTIVGTVAEAHALCAAYAAQGRVDGGYSPWWLEWVELEADLDLAAIRALLTDVVRAESRPSGDDETTPEDPQERIARWRAAHAPPKQPGWPLV